MHRDMYAPEFRTLTAEESSRHYRVRGQSNEELATTIRVALVEEDSQRRLDVITQKRKKGLKLSEEDFYNTRIYLKTA